MIYNGLQMSLLATENHLEMCDNRIEIYDGRMIYMQVMAE